MCFQLERFRSRLGAVSRVCAGGASVCAVVEIGDIERRADKWVVVAPTHCRHGHPLGPNQVLVGHVACHSHAGGHTTWYCRTCPEGEPPFYGPPRTEQCAILIGPAEVR